MKRTLAISLLLGLVTAAAGQTPTVVEKPQNTGPKTAQPVKPQAAKPANVKVVAVPAKPTQGPGKPVVVAGKPVAVPGKPTPAKAVLIAVQPVAKPGTSAQAKPSATPATAKVPVVTVKPSTAQPKVAAAVQAPAVKATVKAVPGAAKSDTHTRDPFNKKQTISAQKSASPLAKPESVAKVQVGTTVAVNKPEPEKKPEAKKISASARRDPFVSPVVRMGAVASGCSSGKRCLAIDQIALKGVVKSDSGMIAVVVNAMDKAYFLRENDPVFNGYVTKITPDSIIFKETFHDKLGKELTRDVTKTISRPAV